VELLISGLKAAEKREALERIRGGAAQLIVGTHAVIEEAVQFARLGLVIVDEQHRFGVLQRKKLMEKGKAPDVLVMTATPIPRTLALTLYGDLDTSVIDEMPPGRVPIETRLTSEPHLAGVWETLRREIARGRQAYVVYPVIEESRAELKAAITEYERLSHEVFPALKLGLLHGRLKSAEKDAVMERFRGGELKVLVATDGDRGWRGRAKRHFNGDRARRPLRPIAAPPIARSHRAGQRKIGLHPGSAKGNQRRCAGTARHNGSHRQRL